MLKVENLDRYLAAVDVAIAVFRESTRQFSVPSDDDLKALQDLRWEIREAIKARNQSQPTAPVSYDDEYRVESPTSCLGIDPENTLDLQHASDERWRQWANDLDDPDR